MKIGRRFLAALLLPLLLAACEGSETYRGKWLAQTSDGTNVDVVFDAKSVSMNQERAAYRQYGVGTQNGVKYYIVEITFASGNTDRFSISFPSKNREEALLILMKDDDPLEGRLSMAMSRKDYPQYADFKRRFEKGK